MQTVEDLRSQLKQAENKYYLRTSEHLSVTKQADNTAQQLKEQITLNTLLKDQVNSLKIKLSTVT